MQYGMPIMFGAMSWVFPSGLSLYMLTNTCLPALQLGLHEQVRQEEHGARRKKIRANQAAAVEAKKAKDANPLEGRQAREPRSDVEPSRGQELMTTRPPMAIASKPPVLAGKARRRRRADASHGGSSDADDDGARGPRREGERLLARSARTNGNLGGHRHQGRQRISTVLEIQTADTELVIGRRGVVIDALQHLVNKAVFKERGERTERQGRARQAAHRRRRWLPRQAGRAAALARAEDGDAGAARPSRSSRCSRCRRTIAASSTWRSPRSRGCRRAAKAKAKIATSSSCPAAAAE